METDTCISSSLLHFDTLSNWKASFVHSAHVRIVHVRIVHVRIVHVRIVHVRIVHVRIAHVGETHGNCNNVVIVTLQIAQLLYHLGAKLQNLLIQLATKSTVHQKLAVGLPWFSCQSGKSDFEGHFESFP